MTDHSNRRPTTPQLDVRPLGLIPYDEAWSLQRDVARRVITGEIPHDVLLLCEHPPVVTLGRGTKPGHLLVAPELLEARGIAVREVERGGDVTIHEPGQLVAYPIVDLKRHRKDLHWYLRQLEEAIIRAVATLGVAAHRREGLTGVWCGEGDAQRKLASIGVHARDWVTWHGLALNVTNDLATFAHVVPCGIGGVEMTTVAREVGRGRDPRVKPSTILDASASALTNAIVAILGLHPPPSTDRTD